MTTGKQAYTEYVEAQFVKPTPSTADRIAELKATIADLEQADAPAHMADSARAELSRRPIARAALVAVLRQSRELITSEYPTDNIILDGADLDVLIAALEPARGKEIAPEKETTPTTHPEDAMTRERALTVEALAEAIWTNGLSDERDKCDLTVDDLSPNDPLWDMARACHALASAQQEPAPSADADATVLRKRFAEYLLPAYLENQCLIAQLCDEQLDRSGALLGYLRDAAARAKPSEKGGAR